MNPGQNKPDDSTDTLMEIVTIRFTPGDHSGTLKQFCRDALGTTEDGHVSLSKIEDLPQLPAPTHIQRQYLEGIFRMAEAIMKDGKVEMPREVYDLFQRCAAIQGTMIERIIATILFQREEGETVELARYL